MRFRSTTSTLILRLKALVNNIVKLWLKLCGTTFGGEKGWTILSNYAQDVLHWQPLSGQRSPWWEVGWGWIGLRYFAAASSKFQVQLQLRIWSWRRTWRPSPLLRFRQLLCFAKSQLTHTFWIQLYSQLERCWGSLLTRSNLKRKIITRENYKRLMIDFGKTYSIWTVFQLDGNTFNNPDPY